MSGVFLIIFTLFWSGMVLMFDGIMTHGACQQFESRQYPSATGIITHSELKSHSVKGGTSCSADIQYQFAVNGQNFTGNKIRFGVTSSSSHNAVAVVNAHPVGSPVPVFYNPANPQEALLSPGVNGSGLHVRAVFNPVQHGDVRLVAWRRRLVAGKIFQADCRHVKIINDGMTTGFACHNLPPSAGDLSPLAGLDSFQSSWLGLARR